jgi:UDPglucose--hexose-1-phosphate uridylyltransferase
MGAITFEERELHAIVPDLNAGGASTTTSLRWRRDPLTGRSARILTGIKLQPPTRPDLSAFAAKPPFCPFCAEHLETATFPFLRALTDEGRIRCGNAVVVPNILGYATHSAVGIYDPARHFVDLDELTPALVGDAFTATVRHARAVRRFDAGAAFSSISANYLPPSGASLVHPHLQSAHDECGTTMQRQLIERSLTWPGGGDYWTALIGEESGGPRWIGTVGRVSWLTPFAPTGFHEVWGVVAGAADVVDLTDDDTAALGTGVSRVLAAYRRGNLTSFNFALCGGGPDAATSRYSVVLKVISRANAEPMYRSDATYFERLHDEALLDLLPEQIAADVRTGW